MSSEELGHTDWKKILSEPVLSRLAKEDIDPDEVQSLLAKEEFRRKLTPLQLQAIQGAFQGLRISEIAKTGKTGHQNTAQHLDRGLHKLYLLIRRERADGKL